MFLISASLTVYSLQTYRMKKEGHSYAYRDFCSYQEGVWGNGFSDVSWLNFPSWKLPIKAHNIYESAQSNRSLYILSILCTPCQLAYALTQGSECLALDEPTNHLDIKYQLQIMDIVKSLGHTVVAAVHDLNIAAMYCDKLIAIQGGKVVGAGTPKALLTPDFIKKLYDVDCEIHYGEDERMNIVYIPQHWKKWSCVAI